jgi:tetratricopeptide (TPR) repeat protein
MLQQLTGDYPAAQASHQHALSLYHDLGQRREQAEVLNSLGELSSRRAASQQAHDYHSQALTLARQVGAPLEEARALDGIGHSYLHDGNTREGTAHLRHALTIYQRIGAPAAQHVLDTLRQHRD